MTRFEVEHNKATDTCNLLYGSQLVLALDEYEFDAAWEAMDVLERVAAALNELALKPKIVREPAGDATYLVG